MQKKAKHFWRDPRGDKNLTVNIHYFYKATNILQLAMAGGLIIIIEIYFLTPYFSRNTIYLLQSYVFVNSTVLEVLLLICQYYVMLIVPPIILGYDSMYLALCIELVVQIKLLKGKLKEVFTNTNGDVQRSTAKYVEQYEFLLW